MEGAIEAQQSATERELTVFSINTTISKMTSEVGCFVKSAHK